MDGDQQAARGPHPDDRDWVRGGGGLRLHQAAGHQVDAELRVGEPRYSCSLDTKPDGDATVYGADGVVAHFDAQRPA